MIWIKPFHWTTVTGALQIYVMHWDASRVEDNTVTVVLTCLDWIHHVDSVFGPHRQLLHVRYEVIEFNKWRGFGHIAVDQKASDCCIVSGLMSQIDLCKSRNLSQRLDHHHSSKIPTCYLFILVTFSFQALVLNMTLQACWNQLFWTLTAGRCAWRSLDFMDSSWLHQW